MSDIGVYGVRGSGGGVCGMRVSAVSARGGRASEMRASERVLCARGERGPTHTHPPPPHHKIGDGWVGE